MTREDNALTYYVPFFIHVGRHKVCFGGMAANPNDSWMRQAARNRTHILVETRPNTFREFNVPTEVLGDQRLEKTHKRSGHPQEM
jgi:hypothetical protein